VYELTKRVNAAKLFVLLLNVVVIIYLVVELCRKRKIH
jgi:uncharacterized membrane protein (DUF2068 family)